MAILGIETSTKTGSVAIISRDRLICQYTLSIDITHSERLMATVDRVLKDARMSLKDIEGFAISIGPGSFTGLRVGIATVKGLAFATDLPVAAVPTLKALAWNLYYSSYPICPLQDAKKKEVYAALYRFEGTTLVQTMDERAISIVELSRMMTGPVVFTGEASVVFRPEIESVFGTRANFAPISHCLPSAASVADIGLNMISEGRTTSPDDLVPMYVRRPEAEVVWEKRQSSS